MVRDWRTRRLSRRYVVALLSLLGLLAFAAVAAGTIAPSTFNGSDGNLTVQGSEKDWANVGISCTAPIVGCDIDLPTGASDNSFGQGTSENDDPPSVVTGSIPNNKSDLLRYYISSEKAGAAPAKDFLYLAWERVQEPQGTTNMDFEFNQGSTLSSNGVTYNRTAGDLLIKYDLSQGGTTPTLGYHRWVTSGDAKSVCEAGNKLPCWDKVHSLAGSFEGAINTASTTDPINPGAPRTLSARTFGEAAINLTDSGLFPSGSCTNFGSGYLKSRSSDSFTSEIKDFIAPIPVNISNCGSITIKKETSPQLGTSSPNFPFTASGGTITPTSFNLQDDGSQPYTSLLAGSYTFTEGTLPSGWDFDHIDCTKTGTSTVTENESGTNRNVVIGLVADDDVVCTFFNKKQPTLTVNKVCVPTSDPGLFKLRIDGTTYGGNANGDTACGSGTGAVTMATGSHTVSELAGASTSLANYDTVIGGQCASDGSVSLDYGDNKVCTITNSRKPTLTVNKVCSPTTDTGLFKLRIDGTTYGGNASGDSACGTGTGAIQVGTGSHTVSELAGASTNLANYSTLIGGQCASDGTVSLSYGDNKVCTITNTRRTFNVTVFVCETTGGTTTLYKSVVTLDSVNKTSLGSVPGSPSGLAASDLCRTDGAGYSNVAPSATHPANVNIGLTQAP